MAHHRTLISLSLISLLILILSACLSFVDSGSGVEIQVQEVIEATLTREAFIQSIDSARETETVKNLPTATQPATETTVPTETPTLSPTPEPLHKQIPVSPFNVHTYISDFVSVDSAKEKTAFGDSYAWSRFERPFTPKTMQYRNYLDIYQVNMQVTDPWIYITFVLIGNLPDEGDIRYAIELDVNHDGRGDYLVSASLPTEFEWTTFGVQVLEDNDGDIGGLFPLYMEGPLQELNGYEKTIFKDGEGEDRDLAWVRREPDNRNQLQIAFKDNLVGSIGFLWSAWTDEGLKDPAMFDYNDQFSFDEAGSPNKSNYRYPLKAVSLIDSTCRSWYGYIPSGSEPGLCFTGEQVQELPGYGWCEATAKSTGCENNRCLTYCPQNRFCLPCKLP